MQFMPVILATVIMCGEKSARYFLRDTVKMVTIKTTNMIVIEFGQVNTREVEMQIWKSVSMLNDSFSVKHMSLMELP